MCGKETLAVPKGPCGPPNINCTFAWPYIQYYIGEKDEEGKKNGVGEHHWSGAQSIEWYTGDFLRDTMHGAGDYRSSVRGPQLMAHTYEGAFYNNTMHGYGTMSYCDGRVFKGLFHGNMRWGPGIETFANRQQNVGLWKGNRLVRLSWRPAAPYIALDMNTTLIGTAVVATHRLILKEKIKNIGETNPALELLKQYGADPLKAVEMWHKLYPPSCTDTASLLCHTDVFDETYYKGQIHSLEVIENPPMYTSSSIEDRIDDSKTNLNQPNIYYAWNNNDINIHMMKHCYKHEMQRGDLGIKLKEVITGPRNEFGYPGKHEIQCRTLLLASYLGDINTIAPLITESNVDPNLTDGLGNSALMYAACGDRERIIHFLLEAGAKVDFYNDSCCTPLGVSLLRYACSRNGIFPSGMIQSITPLLAPVSLEAPTYKNIVEWNISRDPQPFSKIASSLPTRSLSKLSKLGLNKKNRSQTILKDTSIMRKKLNSPQSNVKINEPRNLDTFTFTQEQRLYQHYVEDYKTEVFEVFSTNRSYSPAPYIFDVQDMTTVVNLVVTDEDDKRRAEKIDIKKQLAPKVVKEVKFPVQNIRNSKVTIVQSAEKTLDISSTEKFKNERELNMMRTIEQLLKAGADLRNIRCPQTALFIATVAGNPELVDTLITYGANVNEVCDQTLGYSALDVAISGTLRSDTIKLIRVLLERGATVNHRLRVPKVSSEIELIPGPTLLHFVLAKIILSETEEECCRELLQILLDYGCDPLVQYKGSSAIEIVMSKRFDLLHIFSNASVTDLNQIINDEKQTVIVKMFHLPFFKNIWNDQRLPALTDLLLYGADPLLKCENHGHEYDNLFVFTKEVLLSFEPKFDKGQVTDAKGKDDKKSKADVKPKKQDKGGKDSASTNKGKALCEEKADYTQAVHLVVDCARILYIRWIQAKIMKNIIELVDKFKHRHWNILMKDYKQKKSTGLWLTPVRCLEIWDIFRTTGQKVYNDRTVLRYVMCIASYCNKMAKKMFLNPKLSFENKLAIEREVARAIHEHKMAVTTDISPSKKQYVTPELTRDVEKFNICFECALPFTNEKIICSSCKLIAFCSMECMEINIDRANCHPCSDYLKDKYFPTIEEGDDNEANVDLVF